MARGSERPDATTVFEHQRDTGSSICVVHFRANKSSITMAAGDLEFVLTAKLRAGPMGALRAMINVEQLG